MWSLLAGLATLTLVSAVKYRDCGSVKGTISEVTINPCPQAPAPCHLLRGHNTSVTVNFKSGEVTSSLKAVVHGIIAGLPIAFPLPSPDGCTGTGVSCPISTGSTYTYTAKLPVLKIYPTIKVVVKWELRDANDNNVFCFVVPVEISD